jgi:hypothetical protein
VQRAASEGRGIWNQTGFGKNASTLLCERITGKSILMHSSPVDLFDAAADHRIDVV